MAPDRYPAGIFSVPGSLHEQEAGRRVGALRLCELGVPGGDHHHGLFDLLRRHDRRERGRAGTVVVGTLCGGFRVDRRGHVAVARRHRRSRRRAQEVHARLHGDLLGRGVADDHAPPRHGGGGLRDLRDRQRRLRERSSLLQRLLARHCPAREARLDLRIGIRGGVSRVGARRPVGPSSCGCWWRPSSCSFRFRLSCTYLPTELGR